MQTAETRIVTGWQHSERVIVQAIVDGLALVRYPHRARLTGRTLYDAETRTNVRVRPMEPWAWVPVDDIDID